MTKDQINEIFERARHCPLEQQEKATALLLALEEQGTEVYELTPDELADIEEAEAQAERGEFATDEEIKALLDRYRRQ
jgi:predicted transcriptional regulator